MSSPCVPSGPSVIPCVPFGTRYAGLGAHALHLPQPPGRGEARKGESEHGRKRSGDFTHSLDWELGPCVCCESGSWCLARSQEVRFEVLCMQGGGRGEKRWDGSNLGGGLTVVRSCGTRPPAIPASASDRTLLLEYALHVLPRELSEHSDCIARLGAIRAARASACD